MKIHTLRSGRIHEGDWREADLTPGYSLAIVDGPYAMGIAAWDKMRLDDLADWYAPHVERLTGLMAPSASVYLWNTAAGWARLDPVMRAAGWTFRALVTWEKTNPPSQKGCADMRTWPDVTEVAGFYQREEWDPIEARRALKWAGVHAREIDAAAGVACMASRKWLGTDEQAQAPSGADLVVIRAAIPGLNWPWTIVEPRPAFTLPPGLTNVWTEPLVSGGERLRGPDGSALHPCQKPVSFAERMICASTRPGERVLVPFGGTCREAVACEWMARIDPAEARAYDVCELNADGRDYIGPVLAQIRGEDTRARAAAQFRIFGASP